MVQSVRSVFVRFKDGGSHDPVDKQVDVHIMISVCAVKLGCQYIVHSLISVGMRFHCLSHFLCVVGGCRFCVFLISNNSTHGSGHIYAPHPPLIVDTAAVWSTCGLFAFCYWTETRPNITIYICWHLFNGTDSWDSSWTWWCWSVASIRELALLSGYWNLVLYSLPGHFLKVWPIKSVIFKFWLDFFFHMLCYLGWQSKV